MGVFQDVEAERIRNMSSLGPAGGFEPFGADDHDTEVPIDLTAAFLGRTERERSGAEARIMKTAPFSFAKPSAPGSATWVPRLPATEFAPPPPRPPDFPCGDYAPEEWDRCDDGSTSTECDAIRPMVEAGEHHDGASHKRVMDRTVTLHNFSATNQIFFRQAFLLIMENVDILEWIACCKSTNRAFRDGTHPDIVGTLRKLVSGIERLDVFFAKLLSDVPLIPAITNDVRAADGVHLRTDYVALGWRGWVSMFTYAEVDPSTTMWAEERAIMVINGTNPTIKHLFDRWLTLGGVDARCVELLYASIIVHELVHCAGVPHLLTSERSTDPEVPLTCFVHDRIQSGWLWAMLQRYPEARASTCCSEYAGDYLNYYYDYYVVDLVVEELIKC